MVYVLVPFDPESRDEVLEALDVLSKKEDFEIPHTGREHDAIILVAFDGTSLELSRAMKISEKKIFCMVIPGDNFSGYGPISVKEWTESHG